MSRSEASKEQHRIYRREWGARFPHKVKDLNLRYEYGITLEQYDELLASQGGVCAICGSAPGSRQLSVDHDHESDEVRGLLCDSCNLGLGKFNDNLELLRKACEYLARE